LKNNPIIKIDEDDGEIIFYKEGINVRINQDDFIFHPMSTITLIEVRGVLITIKSIGCQYTYEHFQQFDFTDQIGIVLGRDV